MEFRSKALATNKAFANLNKTRRFGNKIVAKRLVTMMRGVTHALATNYVITAGLMYGNDYMAAFNQVLVISSFTTASRIYQTAIASVKRFYLQPPSTSCSGLRLEEREQRGSASLLEAPVRRLCSFVNRNSPGAS